MFNSQSLHRAIFNEVRGQPDFLFIDGKGDSNNPFFIMRGIMRKELTEKERIQRGVRFLPAQVMRPIFEANNIL